MSDDSLGATAPVPLELHPPTQIVGTASSDRAWKIAQLAATLASSAQIPESPVGASISGPRIASSMMDSYYAAALKRAETILDWAEGKWGELHAYQIFDKGEVLTEDDIMHVFNRHQWAGLKAKTPVINLMAEIRRRFEEDLSRQETFYALGSSPAVFELVQEIEKAIDATFARWLGTREKGDAYTESVRREVRDLLETRLLGLEVKLPKKVANGFLEAFDVGTLDLEQDAKADLEAIRRFIAELKSAFAEQTQSLFHSSGEVEHFYSQQNRISFFDRCFEPVTNRPADRVYRPYEIFLYCAENGWFREKLITDSSTLDIHSIPGPAVHLQRPVFKGFEQIFCT